MRTSLFSVIVYMTVFHVLSGIVTVKILIQVLLISPDDNMNCAYFQIKANLCCQAMLFHYPLPLSLLLQLIAPQPFRIPTVKNVDLTPTTCQSVPHVE